MALAIESTRFGRVEIDPETVIEFPDGLIVLLTELREGQQATVLQLPAQPMTVAEEEAQKRVAYTG